jgi:hypothetical protein
MPQGHGSRMTSRDMPNATPRRDPQAILSSEIDWNAPELQTLSASARDFLERLLQVGSVGFTCFYIHFYIHKTGALLSCMALQCTLCLASCCVRLGGHATFWCGCCR